MDIPFIYDKYVINRDFIGRKSERLALTGLLANGENVVLSEPPRTGKKSLIQQTLFEMRLGGSSYSAAVVKMFNTRKCGEFLTRFAGTVIRSMASSPEEYEDIVSGLLEGTHFVFDRKRFADHDEVWYIETIGGLENTDAHISYLPMAHVFEHFVQCGVTFFGARIGFYQVSPRESVHCRETQRNSSTT